MVKEKREINMDALFKNAETHETNNMKNGCDNVLEVERSHKLYQFTIGKNVQDVT